LKFLNISSSGLPSSKSILSFEIALDVERNFQHYFFRCFLDVHSFFIIIKRHLACVFFLHKVGPTFFGAWLDVTVILFLLTRCAEEEKSRT